MCSRPRSLRQRRGHLDEHLGLQLGEVLEVAAHATGRVVLGEPAGGEDEREDVAVLLRGRRVHLVVVAVVRLARRVGLLPVERVAERRLDRLVVGGHRAVDEALRHVERALPVALHDERVDALDGLDALGPLGRPVGRRLRLLEVGHVLPGPLPRLALLRVPPDVGLALAPRLALGVGRGAVVEDAAVQRPRPAPLGGDERLVVARRPPVGLVDAVGEDTGVDPAAAGRRAVGLHLHEGRQRATGRDLVAVDLLQHRLGAGLAPGLRTLGAEHALVVHGVVPRQVEHGPVALVGGVGQALTHHPAQVVEEPQLRAAVARRVDRLLAPLQHPLGLRERALLLGVRRRREEEHLRAALLRHDLAGRDLG